MEKLIFNIDVPDLARGEMFYISGLGFRKVRRLFDGTVTEMSYRAGSIFLIEQPAGSNPIPGSPLLRDYSEHWTPVHIDIPVPDLDAAVDRASEAGGKLSGSITSHSFGRMATMRDPFGHGFCLIQFSPGGYEHATG